jgi:hypothetical protein
MEANLDPLCPEKADILVTPTGYRVGKGRVDVFAVEVDQGPVWHKSWNSSIGSESADGN